MAHDAVGADLQVIGSATARLANRKWASPECAGPSAAAPLTVGDARRSVLRANRHLRAEVTGRTELVDGLGSLAIRLEPHPSSEEGQRW